MPVHIRVVAPEHLATPIGKKFDTCRFYLECICTHLADRYSDLPSFIGQCHSSTSSIGLLHSPAPTEVKPYLRIAWNTEYLLSIDHGDPEIVRINNQWTPIQAYYAVYSGLEALSYAIDGHPANGHQKAMRKCSSYLMSLGVSPWDKAFEGNRGKSGSAHTPLNFPSGIDSPNNLQRSGVQPLEMIAKCVKAEHSHRIDDKWRSKSESGCFKYQYDPNPTTLLHYLYRLRIKSNYKGVDIFTADAPEENVLQFARSLHSFTSWTLTLIDLILMRRLGKNPILDQATAYLTLNPDATDLDARASRYGSLTF